MPFPQATSLSNSDPESLNPRHQAYEAAIDQRIRDNQLEFINHQKEESHPASPLVSQRYRSASNSVPSEKETNHSAVTHVIHPPSQDQTSAVHSGNIHHLKRRLKIVNTGEAPIVEERQIFNLLDSLSSAGHKEISSIPAPRQFPDTSALGITSLTNFPQPPTFREPRETSAHHPSTISKQASRNFVVGHREPTEELRTRPSHRNIGKDGFQTKNLALRNSPSITPSGQDNLPQQKEVASVHSRGLRAVSGSETPSSESQPCEFTPSAAKHTRQQIVKAAESQTSISSGITRGSPISSIVGLSPSQDLSGGPQQTAPSSHRNLVPLHRRWDYVRPPPNAEAHYLESHNLLQRFLEELPNPPTDSPPICTSPIGASPINTSPISTSPIDTSPIDTPSIGTSPNPEVISTRFGILPSVTKIIPASPSDFSAQKSVLDHPLTASGAHSAEMDQLQVRKSQSISVKTKAAEDARQMQASVLEAATKAGKDPPKYVLLELTGKGSFGRVYKA